MARRLFGYLLSTLLAVAMASGTAAAAGCGQSPNPATPDDRSWVQSSAEMFGAGDDVGVFRFRLGSNRLRPIGHHAGASIKKLQLSTDRTALIYELSDAAGVTSNWLYDVRTGRERQLDGLDGDIDFSDAVYSPNAHQIAGLSGPSNAPSVSIVDLQTGRRRAFTLPDDAPYQGVLIFSLTWSHDGSELLVARRRYGLGEDFLAVDARSGAAHKVEGKREGDLADGDVSVNYFRDGSEIGNDCAPCHAPTVSRAPLAGKAEVVSTPARDIVIRRPGSPDVVVATASLGPPREDGLVMTCGPAPPAIWRVIDGRYILYTRGGGYWIYGVAEKRRARLPGGMFLTW